MRLLGLPGRKSSTYDHMRSLVDRLRLGQTKTTVSSYGFWRAEDAPEPAIEPEIQQVAASAADVVVAKSFGTLITMLACRDHGFAPSRCVFIGVPLRRLEALGLDGLIAAHSARVSTLFIQQTGDFNGPYRDIASLVSSPSTSAEVAGEDHVYGDIDLLARVIHAWLD